MNKPCHDEKLKSLFRQYKQDIPDNGFSEKVKETLPAKSEPWWHYGIIALFLMMSIIVLFAFDLIPSIGLEYMAKEIIQNMEVIVQLLLFILTNKYFYFATFALLIVSVVFLVKRSEEDYMEQSS